MGLGIAVVSFELDVPRGLVVAPDVSVPIGLFVSFEVSVSVGLDVAFASFDVVVPVGLCISFDVVGDPVGLCVFFEVSVSVGLALSFEVVGVSPGLFVSFVVCVPVGLCVALDVGITVGLDVSSGCFGPVGEPWDGFFGSGVSDTAEVSWPLLGTDDFAGLVIVTNPVVGMEMREEDDVKGGWYEEAVLELDKVPDDTR